MMPLFHSVSHACSKVVTKTYSTSFHSAIRLLHEDLRAPIHNIYGFVRLADEIVDTFHAHDKAALLEEFERDTWLAIERGISLNPILHSFQQVVNEYQLPHDLISAFLSSMQQDLHKTHYDSMQEVNAYIYGSAEVVGLMCLYVFCEGDIIMYQSLEGYARSLGAAFQKVNFLRDIQADHKLLNRSYFPSLSINHFDAAIKNEIEQSIEADMQAGLAGIRKLPWKARLGVYTAYRYYNALLKKIKKMQPQKVLEQRVRVPNHQKLYIVLSAGVNNRLNLI